MHRFVLVRLLLLAACGVLLGFSPPSLATENPEVSQDYRVILDEAWGPETPDTLEKFLEVREGLLPIYEQHEMPIQQWALREAATAPTLGPSLFAVFNMAKKVRSLSSERGLSYGDFLRLTYLVYGRWLRATKDEPQQEVFLLRALRELEVGLDRHITNNPPEDEAELAKLVVRLASVRHQIDFLRPFAFTDKARVLARIDAKTRAWLEANRARIEKVDFRFFDTAPPPRDKD